MKQVIAVIRSESLSRSLQALHHLGMQVIITMPVLGRGRQNGADPLVDRKRTLGRDTGSRLRRQPAPLTPVRSSTPSRKCRGPPLLVAQHLLMLMVDDETAGSVVAALVDTNQTGRIGDGKIFVCPVGHVLDIGTGPAR
jgi:nitrogen regulatory protein PII 2